MIVAVLLVHPAMLLAQTYSSTNYKVNETAFGSGGNVDANSASYNALGSIGNLGVGEASSASYGAFAGSITPNEEYLELNVTAGTVDLGNLSITYTGIGSANFYVRSYINGGYVVKTMSQPPSNGAKVLTGMPAAAAGSQGTEQFGINLVANTSPTNASFPTGVGAVPSLQPNSTFANGIAATGYNTPNSYKYIVGDTIAQSGAGRAWGQTNYTVSYIANISPITPGGQYQAAHDIVAIPDF